MARRAQISFATCNLYNINLPGLRMYRDANGWDKVAYDKKIDWTARTLNNMDADIWGFQELWHKDALEEVFQKSGLKSQYKLLVPKNHKGGKIVCAGALKKDMLVGEPEWITDFPDDFRLESGGDDPQTADISVSLNTFSRPVLRFQVKPKKGTQAISVFVVHFKSKAPTGIFREPWYSKTRYAKHSAALGAAISTIRRTAEAAALRMILTDTMKNTGTPVVVMGDLNDSQHSNTLNIVTGQPNYLLSGLSQGGSDTALYTTGTLQEYRSLRDVYYTHIYQNTHESLDHILVSQEFYDNSKKRIWAFAGLEIANDHLNTDDHKENGTSDHGIVKATFEYRPAKK